jgi:hypothetical protein
MGRGPCTNRGPLCVVRTYRSRRLSGAGVTHEEGSGQVSQRFLCLYNTLLITLFIPLSSLHPLSWTPSN